MLRRVRNRLKFILERWIQRGVLYQLLLMAGLIGLVAVLGGVAAWLLTAHFAGPAEAIWWSFLRLTDPGYLGDDEGAILRTISTIVTVLGYVLFMGSLIAIMTQWLHQTMRRLESGLTPITLRDHILILGYTNRTPAIVRELLLSEGRVRRFLRRHGARRLRIVILAEAVDAVLRHELREVLGPHLRRRRIVLRSGSSLRVEHLRRVDFANAAAIIIPGADFAYGSADNTDVHIIKTLMSISHQPDGEALPERPPAVAEMFDVQKVAIAQHAYRGQLDVVASDAFISRLIAQNVRHRGLSHVYTPLLSHAQDNEVYVRANPQLAGRRLWDLMPLFPRAVLLGVVRPDGPRFCPFLNPSPSFELHADDRLVLIARSFDDTAPTSSPPPNATERPARRERPASPLQPRRRLLILGWSHKALPLVQEFGSYTSERFEIDLLSLVPTAERASALARTHLPSNRVRLHQLEGDYTLHADLEQVDPARYDNIVFLSSDWLDSSEESDARTVLGYVLLQSLLPQEGPRPDVLLELIDPANAPLFQQRTGEVIISPLILSHMLAHVALRRELHAVFGELFGPGGAEIFFRSIGDYGLEGRTLTFQDIQQQAVQHGDVALGLRIAAEADLGAGGIHLNPLHTQPWTLQSADEVVVLTTY